MNRLPKNHPRLSLLAAASAALVAACGGGSGTDAADTAQSATATERAQGLSAGKVATDTVTRSQSLSKSPEIQSVVAGGVDATVMTDNVDAGRKACGFIAQRLKGRGNMVIVNGPHLSSVLDRVQACLDVLRAYPEIHVLSSDRDAGGSTPGGFVAMTELLSKYPRIDAVFTINDPTALGAEEAAGQSKRKEFFIVSVDGSPRVFSRMQAPESLIAASVAQRPSLQAQKAVEIGFGLLGGAVAPKQALLIPAFVVTRETRQWPEGAWRD